MQSVFSRGSRLPRICNEKRCRSGFSRAARKRKPQPFAKSTCCGLHIAYRFAHRVNIAAEDRAYAVNPDFVRLGPGERLERKVWRPRLWRFQQ